MKTSCRAIYLVGASSTGKTTLCSALARTLTLEKPQVIMEVARDVMRRTGFSRETVGQLEMQRAIMDAQLEAENKATAWMHENENSHILLSDRSAVDAVVYSILTSTTEAEAIERKKILVNSAQFQEALPRYRRAKFVLLTPVPEWLVDDGVRSLYDQYHCTEVFRQVLVELEIGFQEMGVEMKRLEDRVETLVRIEDNSLDEMELHMTSTSDNSLDLAFFPSPHFSSVRLSPTILKRSSRRLVTKFKQEDSDGLPEFLEAEVKPRKRSAVTMLGEPSPKKSPKKPKRTYAMPDAYAHLAGLPDWLKEELDVMFCGINPGCMSAQKGHHFANPTNHFWRCLHQSGFTERRLPPEEDYTLPDLYCVGLTNLVERPSSEAAELSPAVMVEAVPAFLAKVSKYRPRIVCFVGMGIWRVVEKALVQLIASNSATVTSTVVSFSKPKGTQRTNATVVGIQPYRLIHDIERDQPTISETLFFVVPSTSGRVVSYQLKDKITMFADLKAAVDECKLSKVDTSQLSAITFLKEESPKVPYK